MKKSQAIPTTTRDIEDKFDQSDDVLDYFDVRKGRVFTPQSKRSTAK